MYKVILADPPWQQSKGGRRKVRPNQGIELDYQTISLNDIKNILQAAANISEPDHILFMWTIEKFLPDAENIATELGYRLHARMIWDKGNGIAPAFTVRYSHEYLLYMYRGKFTPVNISARGKLTTVFKGAARDSRHSSKPMEQYRIIDFLYPNTKRLELFARASTNGWDVFGNEVENSIYITLNK